MANPIEEFAKKRGTLTPTIPSGINPIEAFAQNKTMDRAFSPLSISQETEEGKKKLTKWQWISKQLMKPVGVVAVETEAFGRFIGTGQGYVPGKAGLDVLSGKREASFSKVWERNAPGFGLSPSVARKIGFVFDIVDDPFMFIGGGLTKLGKLATKVSSLTKAGKVVKVGSKLGKKIVKSGYTAEELILAGTKAEQVTAGQRALVTALGKPIIGGGRIYKATQRFKQIVGASKVGEIARRTFSTKTGIKEVDELVENFNNLSGYRKQQVIEQATKIERQIKKMSPDDVKMVAEAIENPAIKTTITDKRVVEVADNLEGLFSQMKVTEKAKGILRTELENYFPHIKAKEALSSRIKYFFNPKKYSTALGPAKERTIKSLTSLTNPDLPSMVGIQNKIRKGFLTKLGEPELRAKGFSPYDIGKIFRDRFGNIWSSETATIRQINEAFGKEFFQSNPVIAYAQRGLASAKAITAKEFLDEAGKFFVNAEKAPMGFIESTNPLYKGLKAEPEVVRAIDQYTQGIQPEELKLLVKSFDRVQGWWKAQVLISPSYHLRNTISNFWNNWLAGVKNPIVYDKARKVINGKKVDEVILITDAGEKLTRGQILKSAKQRDVIGKGWYGSDIQEALTDEIGGRWKGILNKMKKVDGWKPWKQDNVLFKTNRAVGSAIEDNARLAHYIDKLQKGFSADDAARSVKKFLFDYADLTQTEKNLFKRVFPFYTWTRKNIPVQLEHIITQPEKFAAVPKVIEQIESGVAEPETEKYMSEYITQNIPVRIRTNKEGNVEYFLLGNWLPSASAIDFLSQPIDSLINMVTPVFKTPYEIWANKSTFFKNTLGEPSDIEYYYKQPTEFVGIPMRKRTASLMRNIRILNDLNKLVKTPAADEPENSWVVKFGNVLIGKAATYDISKSQYFYQRDTQERINELKAAIKKAQKLGQDKRVQELADELEEFQIERSQ